MLFSCAILEYDTWYTYQLLTRVAHHLDSTQLTWCPLQLSLHSNWPDIVWLSTAVPPTWWTKVHTFSSTPSPIEKICSMSPFASITHRESDSGKYLKEMTSADWFGVEMTGLSTKNVEKGMGYFASRFISVSTRSVDGHAILLDLSNLFPMRKRWAWLYYRALVQKQRRSYHSRHPELLQLL